MRAAERKAAAGGQSFDRNAKAMGLIQQGLIGRDAGLLPTQSTRGRKLRRTAGIPPM